MRQADARGHHFGRWLFARRKMLKMTQEELGKRARCSKGYISALERESPHSITGGEIRPSVEMVDSLALALAAPLAEARLAAGYAPPGEDSIEADVEDEQAIAYYRGIPPDLKPTARALLKTLFEQSDREE